MIKDIFPNYALTKQIIDQLENFTQNSDRGILIIKN